MLTATTDNPNFEKFLPALNKFLNDPQQQEIFWKAYREAVGAFFLYGLSVEMETEEDTVLEQCSVDTEME